MWQLLVCMAPCARQKKKSLTSVATKAGQKLLNGVHVFQRASCSMQCVCACMRMCTQVSNHTQRDNQGFPSFMWKQCFYLVRKALKLQHWLEFIFFFQSTVSLRGGRSGIILGVPYFSTPFFTALCEIEYLKKFHTG